ncbi:MAG: arylesterase [Verrucomicrobiota bacterium]|nr:arylesterase [Verrucomicrobiota bacterium]
MNEFSANPSKVSLKTLSLILSFLLVAHGLPAANAAPRAVGAPQTVLVLGDSLSDGFGLTRAQAYPALLQKKAEAAGYRVRVINASASGGTSAGGLQRLPKHLNRPIDVLILELGINDAFRAIPTDDIGKNLQAIIDRTKAKNPDVRVIIARMELPVPVEGYFQDFAQIFERLAKKNNAALLPYLLEGVGGDPSLNIADRIHPNAAGQRILAENVWRVLKRVLHSGDSEPSNAGGALN